MIVEIVSHYRILEELGKGGMGIVYKAIDTRDNRIVALKVMNREATLDADVQRRFLREAGAGTGLVHPSIVQLYESGVHEGRHFLALEFVDGKNLRDVLADGPLPLKQAVDIGIAVGDALQLAHNNGVIHRDIKAENIMVTGGGGVKVMDFGLAKVRNASMLTREGDVVGTIAYMSPEQATGEGVDHRTDIFSLGTVLYELLTGKLPFWADYETAIVYSIINLEPAGPRELRSEIPEALEQIVLKALRKDRAERYQKIEDLTNDLARIKAYFDGERDILPSTFELVAGSGTGTEEKGTSHVKLAVKTGFEAALAGRKVEFEELKSRLERSVAGNGQVVFIGGEPGIGKSRLVAELEAYARSIRTRTLSCYCRSQRGGSPYEPFVNGIREHLRGRNITTREELEAFVRENVPGIAAHLQALGMFLGLEHSVEAELASREQLWQSVSSLLVGLSLDRPLILFIDDLHWGDDDTVQLLAYVLRHTVQSRLLVIGTYRSDEVRNDAGHALHSVMREFEGDDRTVSILLTRLTPGAVKEIVGSLFSEADFGAPFYDSLQSETEGNPLFIVETLKLLKAEGAIEKGVAGYRLNADDNRLSIPKSIHDIVMRRIDRLKEDEREILEIGAVEGDTFHSSTIGACLEMSRIRLLKKLQSLERDHHIIHPEESMYRFDHGKIREFLYDAITPELRVEYHRMIGNYLAEAFPAEEHLAAGIAHHLLASNDARRALPFLVTAGEWARRFFANAQAVRYYEQALDVFSRPGAPAPDERERAQKEVVLEGLGDVWSLVGKHAEALATYSQLTANPEMPSLRKSELLRKMGTVYVSKGDNDKALEVLLESERILNHAMEQSTEEQERQKALGKTRITKSRVFKSLGRYEEAKKEVELGMTLIPSEGNLREKAEAYNNLGVIYEDIGALDLAAEMYGKSLSVLEEVGDKKGVAIAYNNLANVYSDQGDYRRTAEHLRKSLDIMTEIGYRAGIAGACNNLGSVYQDQGRYDESRTMHERCLAIREEIGDKPGIAMSLGNLGSVKLDLGEYQGAKDLLEKNIEMSKVMGFRIFESQVYSWLALAQLRLGDADAARRTVQLAITAAEGMRQRNLLAAAKRSRGIIELALAERETGAPAPDQAGADLEESRAVFEELRMEHEAGRSLYHLARYYQKRGEAARCRESLMRSKEIFQKLGALGDLSLANKLHITT